MNSTPDLQSLTSELRPRISRLGLGWIVFVLLLQFWSRYMPAPMAVFVADDWANRARASFYSSHAEAFLTGLQDPNRPISMAMVEFVFRLFGDDARYWTMLSLAANSVLLLLVYFVAREITGRAGSGIIAAVFFALWPTLTETYHWSTQILNEVSCALVFYVFSAWMWAQYARLDGLWRLGLSVVSFAIAIFSYEAGLLLPTAYVFLLPFESRIKWIKNMWRVVPFGLVAITYLAWRSTNAFGMNHSWYYPPHMEADISLAGIYWNVREFLFWWMGDHLAGSLFRGWQGFAELPVSTGRWLVAINLLLASCVCFWLPGRVNQKDQNSPPFTKGQVIGFVMVWLLMASVIPLLSYTAPRLMVLPAIGIAWVVVAIIPAIPRIKWQYLLFFPVVLVLISNQGTAVSYRQAGQFNLNLYKSLNDSVAEWSRKEALVVDTSAIRHRLSGGLLDSAGNDPLTWANYRNALLLRGFVGMGMVRSILNDPNPGIEVLHDVENGVHYEYDTVFWHERYQSGVTRHAPRDSVFILDTGQLMNK